MSIEEKFIKIIQNYSELHGQIIGDDEKVRIFTEVANKFKGIKMTGKQSNFIHIFVYCTTEVLIF